MNELHTQKNSTPTGDGLRSEAASLNNLLGMLNNPALTGAEVPPDAKEKVKVRVPMHPNLRRAPSPALTAPVPTATTQPESGALDAVSGEASPVPAASTTNRVPVNRLFFTGGMGVGKDYVAAAAGAFVIGFADPIYSLVEALFPGLQVTATEGKDIPGVRELLQTLGQWGRGEVNAKYPLTPARALMRVHVLSLANGLPADLCVDWSAWGVNKDIWLDSLLARAAKLDAVRRVAATNVRFENELRRLRSDGWAHYHVMCSQATRQDRLRKIGVPLSGASLSDMSERLAMALDADVTKKIKQPGTSRLKVIWNDTAPPPSPRIFTVNQWLQELAIGEIPAQVAETAPAMSLE
jgi:hypothetical protein